MLGRVLQLGIGPDKLQSAYMRAGCPSYGSLARVCGGAGVRIRGGPAAEVLQQEMPGKTVPRATILRKSERLMMMKCFGAWRWGEIEGSSYMLQES